MYGEEKISNCKGKFYSDVFISVPLEVFTSCRAMYYVIGYYVGTSFRVLRKTDDILVAYDAFDEFKHRFPSRNITLHRFKVSFTKIDEI